MNVVSGFKYSLEMKFSAEIKGYVHTTSLLTVTKSPDRSQKLI